MHVGNKYWRHAAQKPAEYLTAVNVLATLLLLVRSMKAISNNMQS
jgi:hypothetical protein